MSEDGAATVEYDESLGNLLTQYNFDAVNITDICKSGLTICLTDRKNIFHYVKVFQADHKTGCVFALPSNRRDNSCYVIYSPMSSEEIRRIIELRAFL
jgi:hypothetical protein